MSTTRLTSARFGALWMLPRGRSALRSGRLADSLHCRRRAKGTNDHLVHRIPDPRGKHLSNSDAKRGSGHGHANTAIAPVSILPETFTNKQTVQSCLPSARPYCHAVEKDLQSAAHQGPGVNDEKLRMVLMKLSKCRVLSETETVNLPRIFNSSPSLPWMQGPWPLGHAMLAVACPGQPFVRRIHQAEPHHAKDMALLRIFS